MNLQIEIDCGKTTCASEPGKFCQFTGTKQFGTQWYCTLFHRDRDTSIKLFENSEGWLLRCKECLDHD